MLSVISRYTITVAINYIILISGTYLLVNKLELSSSVSYFLVVTFIYFIIYITNTKFVFRVEFNRLAATKYTIFLFIFWIFNNIFFNFFVLILNISYLIAIILNIVFLGFARFFLYKNFVFIK